MIFFEFEQVTRIHSSLINNHPFSDGNKRIGIHLTLLFLIINNVQLNYVQQELMSYLSMANMATPSR